MSAGGFSFGGFDGNGGFGKSCLSSSVDSRRVSASAGQLEGQRAEPGVPVSHHRVFSFCLTGVSPFRTNRIQTTIAPTAIHASRVYLELRTPVILLRRVLAKDEDGFPLDGERANAPPINP